MARGDPPLPVDRQRLGVGRPLVEGEDEAAHGLRRRAIASCSRARDSRCRQAISLEQKLDPAGRHEFGKADDAHRTRSVADDEFCDRAAEAAADRMLLDGDDRAEVGGGANRLDVERRNRRHVDDARADALFGERVGRRERARDHDAVGDDRDVVALTQRFRLADREGRVGAARQLRYAKAADAQEHRPVAQRGRLHRLARSPTDRRATTIGEIGQARAARRSPRSSDGSARVRHSRRPATGRRA